MKQLLVAAILPLLWAAPANTRQSARADVAVVHAAVLTMQKDDAILQDHTVIVGNGRIVALGPSASTPLPAGVRQVDGRGRFLMPGLADMHVHLEYFDDPSILGLFTVNGITTVRNMDGRPYLVDWKRRIAAGTLHGPRLYTAGPLLDGDPPIRSDNTVVTTPAQASAAVDAQVRDGYDFIKVYSALSREAYGAILRSAAAHKVPVSGHVPGSVGLDAVLDARQRSIEHLADFASAIQADTAPGWSRRYLSMPVDPAKIATLAGRLAKGDVWVVPTLVQPEREVLRSNEIATRLAADEVQFIPADGREIWERQVRGAAARMDEEDWKLIAAGRAHRLTLVQAFHAAGVRMLAGTDTPNPFVVPGFSLHDELALLVDAGLSPAAALATATREAARYVGASNWGTIHKDAAADLVLVAGNPLDDIANTRRIVGVMVKGSWMGPEERAAMLKRLRTP
jgi:imidazolonepropionase-like amidohydrolase